MAFRVRKTDHAGAKNGGGDWGTRAEAKQQSARLRRRSERLASKVRFEAADESSWPDAERVTFDAEVVNGP
jgi:hypothetical protein